MTRFAALLRWRLALLTPPERAGIRPEVLAASLSCEGLPREQVPPRMDDQITAFRHLRQDARVAACRSFLEPR